jgi:hypothetical protein
VEVGPEDFAVPLINAFWSECFLNLAQPARANRAVRNGASAANLPRIDRLSWRE